MRVEFPERTRIKWKIWVRRCKKLENERQNNETIVVKERKHKREMNRNSSDGRTLELAVVER